MTDQYDLIAPKFRSRKAFVKAMDKAATSILERGDVERNNQRVSIFVDGADVSHNSFITALVSFGSNTHPNKYLLSADCLKDNQWNLQAYLNTWLRLFISYQIDFYNFEKIYRERGCSSKGSIGLPQSIGDFVSMIAIFGNRSLFENAVNFALDLFDRRLVGGDITYLTQLFIMRIAENFLGLSERNWSGDPYWGVDPRADEPLFAELWRHWDAEDTTELEPLLIQLLNRHTFEASRKNKYGDHDFEGHSEQFPMELFFLYRLREWRGLKNPVIKHRLTEPPFDALPKPMEELVFDEQSIAFVKKVREVFPNFNEVVNNAKIRDWKMLL
ncbi:MAG: hypothetical protein EOO07_10005 [Chitinophagaceae bacterium]|nr:MAG: hypothetical protein EOO07_10005 [Chitinophagaceae bacterium]